MKMNPTNWLEKYRVDCMLKYQSKSTQNSYSSCVGLFLEYFKFSETPSHIKTEEIKLWLLQSESFATRNHRLCAIKSFYQLTVGMPLKLDKIPFARKDKTLPRFIDQDEILKRILAIENKKHKAILAIAYGCALRVSEVVNLTFPDIDFDHRVILIRLSKGRKDRYVGLSETCAKIVLEYLSDYHPEEFVFEGQFGGKYSTRSCQEIYHKYIDTSTSFHSLRHASLTSMIEKGTNILAVQMVAGHKNPKTTSIYYHTSKKFLASIPSPI